MTNGKSLTKRFLRRIAHWQVEHPLIVLAIIIAIMIIMLGGAGQVRTVAALENMMPQDIPEIAAFNTLRDAGMGQDIIAVVIGLDPENNIQDRQSILSYEYYTAVHEMTNKLRQEKDILAVHSLSALLETTARNGGMIISEGTMLSESSFNELVNNSLLSDEISNYVNDARTNTIIIATTDVSANDERMNLLADAVVRDVESAGRPPETRIKLTGTPIIQQELGRLISHDRQVTKNISTLFVFLIVMLIFGTITSALVPIAVVSIAVTWLYGTMGYVNLPISTLAGGVAAMVIGIGIDYAIHLMSKFKYERKQGLDAKTAIELAVTETGIATFGASMTTILAFIAFLTGSMPEMQRFGILMTLGVAYSFLLTIFALPAMLVIEERLFFLIRKHLHFGVEGEYFLATKNEVCPPGYRRVKKNEHEHAARKVVEEYEIFKKDDSKKANSKKESAKSTRGRR